MLRSKICTCPLFTLQQSCPKAKPDNIQGKSKEAPQSYGGQEAVQESAPALRKRKMRIVKEVSQKSASFHSNHHNIAFWEWWAIGLVHIVQNCEIETLILSDLSHVL